jgi:hypothetical protein
LRRFGALVFFGADRLGADLLRGLECVFGVERFGLDFGDLVLGFTGDFLTILLITCFGLGTDCTGLLQSLLRHSCVFSIEPFIVFLKEYKKYIYKAIRNKRLGKLHKMR